MITKENWHAITVEETLKRLDTTLLGLSWHQALARLKKYGPNKIPIEKKRTFGHRIFDQFNNILIYILLSAAVITALLQHWIDTSVILSVVVINAIIGLIQEGKAEKALEALKQMLPLYANVIRSGKRDRILADELVPGDMVLLRSGDKVPADLRLVKTANLQIQEALLTGESVPDQKHTFPVQVNTPLADRSSMAYSGTFVTYGTGMGIVVSTAKNTEVGHISTLLTGLPKLTTPLLQQMNKFARWLAIIILLFSLSIFLFGVIFRQYPLQEMFLATVAIAVSVVPEGLPALITIILAVGVTRMARRNAVIRRLPAVETLSSVTVICTDKTGTLTRNELTVQRIITSNQQFFVSGSGYNDGGKIIYNNKEVDINQHPDLALLIRSCVLCNDAELKKENRDWHLYGNPMDGALLALGLKAGIQYKDEMDIYHRTDTIPFESIHKFMASLHHDHKGNAIIFVKGAPERILEMCSHQKKNQNIESIDKNYWQSQINHLAETGMRVLAFAYCSANRKYVSLLFKDVEKNLIFLGLVGLIDPPRIGARESVIDCQKAGIRIKMVTGDHRATARTVAEQVGINNQHVLVGENLDAMDDTMLEKWVDNVDVYARTTPEHKLRLITALRNKNHIIAMTGDGVNDAPALHHADIGIAMGYKGTDVAKEAAEIVLIDDNFVSIKHAVEEARVVYENLKKALLFILPTNGGEGLSIFFAILLGYTLPITPLQILWVNMITTVTLGLALAFEPPERHIMRQLPRNPKESLFTPFLLWRISFVSFFFVCSIFGLFIYEIKSGLDIFWIRTMVVNMLVLAEAIYVINCRKIFDSVLNKEGLLGSKPVLISILLVLVLQICFTYLPAMQFFFETKPISLNQWSLIFIIALSLFLIIEFEKTIARRFLKLYSRKQ
ncbi:MAG: cation-transporting P-type ATPase [Gammaproteobacteria bacterium]|nr:cation-transporting P-type ATPase [Gammaproteobacteria bacterium]